MLDNDKLILVYGLDKEETELLSKILKKDLLPSFKVIEKEMSSMKVCDIINGLNFQIYDKYMPDEKVVLFNSLSDEELNSAIDIVRKNIQGTIMAVITPKSINWTFKYLLEHLIEEREWFRKNSGDTK